MVNILFIAEDTSGLLYKNFSYLEEELSKIVNIKIWRKSGHIRSILKKIEMAPDFILILNDIDRRMSPVIRGLAHIEIPTGLFVNDVHRFTKLRKNYVDKNQISYLFPVVRDKFIETYPEYRKKMKWFPHGVNIELFRDYGIEKDIPLLMTGAVNNDYPLRQIIVEAYEGQPGFIHHRHPGYRRYREEEEKQYMIGKQYAKELNRAKIMFTSPSVYYYPVLKYFEALASKTLLLAPTFKELEDLGFVPDVHFVPIHKHNFKEKAAYFLKNEEERIKIAEQGYQFVRNHHSIQVRARQLVKKIEYIVRRT
ncbi:Glycosyl transferases group 1 [Salinibacillus kushneri]|uniref:Glycosyl transferases group 1 n=1 Tax=Salinibacillus kushneri TaxID=237682 RepID=A0A1I0AG62_9BACI|nr:glycosyltransferase [Salinibacillus kushneri]SES93163.1 Glycosyl transferases group 1 [Salinibacillus kushneri]